MPIEFPLPRSVHPTMAASLDFARMADERAATARTADEKATFARIANAARRVDAQALSPTAKAAFARAEQAFNQHDAATAERSTAAHDALNRSLDAQQAMPAGQINASFGLIRGRLPEAVQATLDRIEEQLDEVRAMRRNMVDEQQDLIKERGDIITKIRINTEKAVASRYGVTVLMSEDHPTLIKLRADQARLDKRLEKINEKLAASQPRFEALDRLQERCRAYVRYLLGHSVEFVLHDGKVAKKQASGDLKQLIADIRQKIAKLAADLREHRARPRRSADVKARVPAFVHASATPPNVLGALDHGEDIHWPIVGVRGRLPDPKLFGSQYNLSAEEATSIGATQHALGVLCWAFPDQIISAIERQIDVYADDANALSDEDRARGEANLLAQLLAAERDEEALIQLGEEREMQVYRRGDADVRCVLGLASNLPPMMEAV